MREEQQQQDTAKHCSRKINGGTDENLIFLTFKITYRQDTEGASKQRDKRAPTEEKVVSIGHEDNDDDDDDFDFDRGHTAETRSGTKSRATKRGNGKIKNSNKISTVFLW